MKYAEAFALAILAVFAPIEPIMITTGALIAVDLVMGILASNKRQIPITSAALRRTVTKMLVYQLTIISGFICEKYLLSDLVPMTKLIAGIIGTVELRSILENADIINGGPIFKTIVYNLGSVNDKEIAKLEVKKPEDSKNQDDEQA
jgi:hypothetical protein